MANAEYTGIERRHVYRRKEDVPGDAIALNPPEKKMLQVIAGGSFAEFAGGIGAVVLAIIGLAGAAPVALAAVCALSIGGAILVNALSIGAEFSKLTGNITGKAKRAELGIGLSAEFFAGVGAVTLGILSLMGVSTQALLPITAIVLGGGFLFAVGPKQRVNALRVKHADMKGPGRVTNAAVKGTVGGQVIVGIGSIILGILGLMTPNVILTLVAMLSMGSIGMLGGSFLAGRMFSMAKAHRLSEATSS